MFREVVHDRGWCITGLREEWGRLSDNEDKKHSLHHFSTFLFRQHDMNGTEATSYETAVDRRPSYEHLDREHRHVTHCKKSPTSFDFDLNFLDFIFFFFRFRQRQGRGRGFRGRGLRKPGRRIFAKSISAMPWPLPACQRRWTKAAVDEMHSTNIGKGGGRMMRWRSVYTNMNPPCV